MSEARNKFLKMRVSDDELARILEKIENEFGGGSFSNANRILWGLSPAPSAGAPKGNQNKLGKKGANSKTKKS